MQGVTMLLKLVAIQAVNAMYHQFSSYMTTQYYNMRYASDTLPFIQQHPPRTIEQIWGYQHVPQPVPQEYPRPDILDPFAILKFQREQYVDRNAFPINLPYRPSDFLTLSNDVYTIAENCRYYSFEQTKEILRTVCSKLMPRLQHTSWVHLEFDMGELLPKSGTWVEKLALVENLLPPPIAAMSGWQDDNCRDEEDFEPGHYIRWHREVYEFMCAFKDSTHVPIVIFDDFIASGDQMSINLQSFLYYPSTESGNKAYLRQHPAEESYHVSRAMFNDLLLKIELYVVVMFLTKDGQEQVEEVCESSGVGKYSIIEGFERVMSMDALAEKDARLNKALENHLIYDRNRRKITREKSKSCVLFSHKFPDGTSMAFRDLVKISYPHLWQQIRIPPYKVHLVHQWPEFEYYPAGMEQSEGHDASLNVLRQHQSVVGLDQS